MTTIEAIYENGVFKPVQPVSLPERQRVQIDVRPVAAASITSWLAEARQLRDRIAARVGVLPDSTPEIAEDRRRDV
jgi:predicted DNA-binding antitoxin AbrB/MazE fold protein